MKKIVLILLCCAFMQITLMAGGGWVQPRGKGYFKLGQNFLSADRFFAPDKSLVDITTVGMFTTSLYGEYGISDRFAAIAYVPFFTRTTLNKVRFQPSGRELPGDELNGFGDMDISLQYALHKSETWVASARVLLGFPTGNPRGGASGILQTGDGEFNQMLRFDLSRPIGQKAWAGTYVGYNNRTRGFSDEWRYGIEIGLKLGQKSYIQLKTNVVQSTFNGDASQPEGNTIFANNVEFISPGIEFGWENKSGLGFNVSAEGAFSGRNILAAPNIAAGITYALR
jgi:hypothetical protein